MKISYKKLWILLAEKEISKSDFRKQIAIAPSTMTKLNKNEPVSMDLLLRVCEKLHCSFGDICDAVPNDSPANGTGNMIG